MGLILQIIGFLFAITSLVLSVIAIINGSSKTTGLLLLAIGASLIKIGRDIHKNQKQ